MGTNLKFSQHYLDGTMAIRKDEIVDIDLADDKYHASVLLRSGIWIRLNKSFNEVTTLLY